VSVLATIGRWQQRIREAAASGTALRPRGFGSKDFYGGPLVGEVFDTREHCGIVRYEPTELVVTVRCGTPLAELEAVLAERGQWLACEPPHFGGAAVGASVGGMVAAGLAGPGRMAAGGVRDGLLGVELIDGRGELLRFGGEVMKNVAGYDVSRLFAGSLGTLGLLTEVSLKVLPRPPDTVTCVQAIDRAAALSTMNRLAGQGLPLTASAWCDGRLWLRLAGARPAVDKALRAAGGEMLEADAAAALWQGLRDQTHPFFAPALRGEAPLWRIALPATAADLALPGAQLIEWNGAQRWYVGDLAPSGEPGRAAGDALVRAAGAVTRFRSLPDSGRGDALPARAAALAAIDARLKAAFDPAGIFCPGRLPATA
jgi:glycolate oxidase FAD binding subunit